MALRCVWRRGCRGRGSNKCEGRFVRCRKSSVCMSNYAVITNKVITIQHYVLYLLNKNKIFVMH